MLSIKTVSINDMDKQTTKEKKTTTQILKRWATGTPQKTGGEPVCSQVVSLTSISLLETRCSFT
jgi:hypothetical protein